jgi:hypothetical protein
MRGLSIRRACPSRNGVDAAKEPGTWKQLNHITASCSIFCLLLANLRQCANLDLTYRFEASSSFGNQNSKLYHILRDSHRCQFGWCTAGCSQSRILPGHCTIIKPRTVYTKTSTCRGANSIFCRKIPSSDNFREATTEVHTRHKS